MFVFMSEIKQKDLCMLKHFSFSKFTPFFVVVSFHIDQYG
jgi:hypothetical protein